MYRIQGRPENVETLVESKQVSPEVVGCGSCQPGSCLSWPGMASAGVHNGGYDFQKLMATNWMETEHFQTFRFQERVMQGF